jgi:predicted PurR-regulated permease PerM
LYITIGSYRIPVIRILVGIVIFVVFYRIRDLLFPFILAGIFAFMILPLVDFLEKIRMNRSLAILIIYVIVFGTLGIALAFLIPITISQIYRFIEALPEYNEQIRNFISSMESSYEQISLPQSMRIVIDRQIRQFEIGIIATTNTIIERFFGLYRHIINLLITPIFTFYVLKDSRLISKSFYNLFSPAGQEKARQVMADQYMVMRQFFRGQFMVCIILSILYTSLFAFVGVRYSLVLGIFAGFANIVPYLGPMLGTLFPMIIASFQAREMVFVILFLSFVIQQMEGYVISPWILGRRRVDLHPLIIILAVLAGARFFGFTGIIFAIPIAGSIRVFIRHFVKPEYLQFF